MLRPTPANGGRNSRAAAILDRAWSLLLPALMAGFFIWCVKSSTANLFVRNQESAGAFAIAGGRHGFFPPRESPGLQSTQHHAGHAIRCSCVMCDVWLLLQMSTHTDSWACNFAVTCTQSLHACFMSGSYTWHIDCELQCSASVSPLPADNETSAENVTTAGATEDAIAVTLPPATPAPPVDPGPKIAVLSGKAHGYSAVSCHHDCSS